MRLAGDVVSGLPTFEDKCRRVYVMLCDVENELRFLCDVENELRFLRTPGAGPTRAQAKAVGEAKAATTKALDALEWAAP